MAKPFHKLLAESLSRVEKAAKEGFVRSEDISRRDRERLLKGGWLEPIIAGWYLLISPQAEQGESTAWFASFWVFIQQYLQEKFEEGYCLSAESSLDIHTADNIIPNQVVAITKKSGHYTLSLPHQTSIIVYQDINKFPSVIDTKDKLQVMPVSLALCRIAKSFFQRQPMNAKIALSMLRDPSELTRHLLQDGMVQSAGRLAGAYRHIGRDNFSQEIIQTMKAAGFSIIEENPFDESKAMSTSMYNQRIISPYHARITSMWEMMREDIINNSPKQRITKASPTKIMKHIDDIYINDAYNSLSIEGYKVSKSLIAKIKSGEWNPEQSEADLQQRNALAAKGYYLAFLAVKESINKIFENKDVMSVLQKDLSKWYQALFSPSVEAGLIESVHLAGYRNDRVYIRHSLHVPPLKKLRYAHIFF